MLDEKHHSKHHFLEPKNKLMSEGVEAKKVIKELSAALQQKSDNIAALQKFTERAEKGKRSTIISREFVKYEREGIRCSFGSIRLDAIIISAFSN